MQVANAQRAAHLAGADEKQTLRNALRQLGAREPGDKGGKKDVIPFSGEYEWYTPSLYVEAARAVMGSIDCDPGRSVAISDQACW